jgi:hypothetical protein
MPIDPFDERRKALEEEFFEKKNKSLMEKLRNTFQQEVTREGLKKATGITSEEVLNALVTLNVTGQTMAAFALYPLVEVAWADGQVDDKERAAVLRAAAEEGVETGSPAHTLLEQVLTEGPNENRRKVWFAYARELNQRLTDAERRVVREELVRRARVVAEASGSFLGVGRKVSAGEERVLRELVNAFPD